MEPTIYCPQKPRQWDLPDCIIVWDKIRFGVYLRTGACVYVYPDGEAIASDGCHDKPHAEAWALNIVRHLPHD